MKTKRRSRESFELLQRASPRDGEVNVCEDNRYTDLNKIIKLALVTLKEKTGNEEEAHLAKGTTAAREGLLVPFIARQCLE